MSFKRHLLPDPPGYYESRGLKLTGPRSAKWKTATCPFHGGSDSMRINTVTGAYSCMAGCGARGGDVLAYEMALTGADFVTAAKAIGAWEEDGKPQAPQKPTPLSPRAALSVMHAEAMLTAIAAGNLARGVQLTVKDRARLLTAANRILHLAEAFQ